MNPNQPGVDITTLTDAELVDIKVFLQAQITVANYQAKQQNKRIATQVATLTGQVSLVEAEQAKRG